MLKSLPVTLHNKIMNLILSQVVKIQAQAYAVPVPALLKIFKKVSNAYQYRQISIRQ